MGAQTLREGRGVPNSRHHAVAPSTAPATGLAATLLAVACGGVRAVAPERAASP